MIDSWHAIMIAADADLDGAPLLRKEFSLDAGHGSVISATLRATSLGIYEALLNQSRTCTWPPRSRVSGSAGECI